MRELTMDLSDMPDEKGGPQIDVSQRWTRYQRDSAKTTIQYPCRFCDDRKIHSSEAELWSHTQDAHQDILPDSELELGIFRKNLQSHSNKKYLSTMKCYQNYYS